MKKIIALSLSAALLLAMLCACGDPGAQNTSDPGKSDENTTQSVEPTLEPTPEPPANIDLNAMWDEIAALGEMPMLGDTPEEILSGYGIDTADLEDYISKSPMMNVQATEFFIAKVKPGKMDTVKKAVEGRVDDLVEQWSQYLPEQLELVEDARVVTNGDYIMLAISEHAGDAVKAFNDHTK